MNRKHFLTVLCVVFAVVLCFSSVSEALVLPFETQFEYSEADISWLTDLSYKEDIETIGGIASNGIPVPDPLTPYRETPSSFKNEVNNCLSAYSLDENSLKTGYIYLFELLNSAGELYSQNVNDSVVITYLKNIGITDIDSNDNSAMVIARALYTALVTGAFPLNGKTYSDIEEIGFDYLCTLSGISKEALIQWIPAGSISGFDEYVLAASKLCLFNSGFEITPETDMTETARLTAVMTIENLGISVDRNADIESLKTRYTSVLLGKKFGITCDEENLRNSIDNNTAAYYVLSLIGEKYGISVREDTMDFEEAFYAVADNSGYFNLDKNDFYADVKNYDIYLKSKRSSLWLCPTAYSSNAEISCGTVTMKSDSYAKLQLNPSLEKETLEITVSAASGSETARSVYYITVHQGDTESQTSIYDSEEYSFRNSDSVVSGVLSSLGLNTSVSALVESVYSGITPYLSSVISFIAPTFDDTDDINNAEGIASSVDFNSVLDKLGEFKDYSIKGIDGLDYSTDVSGLLNLIDFGG